MKFLIFILCVAAAEILTWQPQDTYWNKPLNWKPAVVPARGDTVIIPRNSTVPPYIDGIVEIDTLKNYFMVDIYGGSLSLRKLHNNGTMNIYISNFTCREDIFTVGIFHFIHSRLEANFIIGRDAQLGGTGYVAGHIFNMGLVLPQQVFRADYFENFGRIDYVEQMARITAKNITLFGTIIYGRRSTLSP